MTKKKILLFLDGRSDFLKNLLETHFDIIPVNISISFKVLKGHLFFLRKIISNYKLIFRYKLYKVHLLLKYLTLYDRDKSQIAILVYHSLNPYLHFSLYLKNVNSVICILPFFVTERHKKSKFLHPGSRFVIQSKYDKIHLPNAFLFGSFYLSLFYQKSDEFKKFEIGFISQLTEEYLVNGAAWKNLIQNIRYAVLDSLINSNGSFAILLRHPSTSSLCDLEQLFYNTLISDHSSYQVNYLFPDKWQSYKSINLCKVIVSVNSNLAFEALAVGVKVIFYIKYRLEKEYYTHSVAFKHITVNNLDSFSEIYLKIKSLSLNDYYNLILDKKDFPLYNQNYIINLIDLIDGKNNFKENIE